MENLYKTGTLNLVGDQGISTVIALENEVDDDDAYESEVEKEVQRVQKNATRLVPGEGQVPEEAIKYMVKVQLARASTAENPWYRFITMISSFSTEPITKLWKDQKQVKEGFALSGETSGGVYSAIDAAVKKQGSVLNKNYKREQEVGEYVENRRDFLVSPEVYGKLFLSPMIVGHISEAQQLIQNHCHVSIDLDSFIQGEHATYFARLVSLRMNLSRFLSGRYYTLSGNYGRLMTQNARLLEYFKCRLLRHPNGHGLMKIYPTETSQRQLALKPPTRMKKEARWDPAHPLGSSTSHSYINRLGQL